MLLRPTVYAQFVAGESESEIAQSMRRMSSLGLRPMLAVPIEEDLGESSGYNSHHKNKSKTFLRISVEGDRKVIVVFIGFSSSSSSFLPECAVPCIDMLAFVTTREKKYDDNMQAMLECVRISHSNTWSKDPMMQLKVTALLNPELCVRQINDLKSFWT